MNKTIILPILTTLFLVLQGFTGKHVDDNTVEQIGNGILALVTLWGIFKNHRK